MNIWGGKWFQEMGSCGMNSKQGCELAREEGEEASLQWEQLAFLFRLGVSRLNATDTMASN